MLEIRQTLERQIYPFFTLALRECLEKIDACLWDEIQEIRLRINKPVVLVIGQGDLITDYIVTQEEMGKLLQLLSRSSLYALAEELRNGYLTLPGGHRVGVVGQGVLEQGRVKTLKNISGLNVRISREIKGAADKLLPYLVSANGDIYHTLLVSPPQAGKTTLLRDIARQLSSGCQLFSGVKVGIVDERSEIAACYQGIAQRDVGLRTDILDACPKAEGMMMLIRSMSPQILLTDEIGRKEDLLAIEEAVNSGVKVITSAHGCNWDDLQKRPTLSDILAKRIFQRLIFLSTREGPGTIEKILNNQGGEVRC